ncbi:MAG: hypothetical protein H6Q90_77 [Deltaproteobacteria bacterium]|nr:hypothetical protein [Deltaproteobacteria bacterium]
MGRLQDIVERNKHPARGRDRFSVGVTSLVLLVVVGLLAFTALQSGDPPKPVAPIERRVHDVKLYRAPGPAKAGSATR